MIKKSVALPAIALHAKFCMRVDEMRAKKHLFRLGMHQEIVLEWLLGPWSRGEPVYVTQTVTALSGGSRPLVSRSPMAIYRSVHQLAEGGWLKLDKFPDERRRKMLLPTKKTERYFALLAGCMSEVVLADSGKK